MDGAVAECVPAFMHNRMQEFDSSIRILESDSATVIEVHSVMNHLRGQLVARRKDQFYGSKAKQTLRKLLPLQQEKFKSLVFERKQCNILEDKFDFNDQIIAHIACLSLKEGQSLQWSSWNF